MDISDIVEEFYSGRAIMYLLGICSILSLAAILERAFAVRRRRILGGMPGVSMRPALRQAIRMSVIRVPATVLFLAGS